MRRRVSPLGALLGALLGVGLGVVVSGPAAAYALVLTPLAAGLGAVGGAIGATRSSRVLGAAFALGTAIVVTAVLALIRFRYAGATGLPEAGILVQSREFQMVVGLLPGVVMFGASLGGALRSTLGGAGVALMMGPVLIGLTLLATVPWLRPPVPAIVVLAIVSLAAWRRR
ncbi:MAG: hypothetical protein ACKVZ0_16565 [Gemmatimonadales bacterium]